MSQYLQRTRMSYGDRRSGAAFCCASLARWAGLPNRGMRPAKEFFDHPQYMVSAGAPVSLESR